MTTTARPEFTKWPSIQRLSSEVCYITEKIDGTNGVIYVGEDGVVLAGSRERWLSKSDGTPCRKPDDNFGFSQWVYDRNDSLKRLGVGYHYGEFHGHNIQRGYGVKTRRFASFEHWRSDIDIQDVCVVPLLFTGDVAVWAGNPLIGASSPQMPWDTCITELKHCGSTLYPGFMNPEGVVVTFKEMKTCKFKRMCENDRIHKKQQKETISNA